MKTAQGGLLVVLGLFVLWLAVTGRMNKLAQAFGALSAAPAPGGDPTTVEPAGSWNDPGMAPGAGALRGALEGTRY